ncbi:DUF1376 domain-containing protein [Burkholderia gladioli]|uniref:DUF1376 domain-containing protein n=1 Tax=Burkholderia gladioli TaxID=28095 RepID=UPI001C5FFC71|nr:DUF1376 domain-containing protein [Burkholderia gladioli]MBW5285964.1 DUF1376 domain-containing protein [Burkholderia gladioli]
MNDLPKPLTPADCNLRDFPFMPIEVKRLLTSETWILGTGDERAAAITLWLESWHQIPAASLPNDDRMLSHLSQAKSWKRVKEHALRGWIKCADGRLYHPVAAEKVLEAWLSKLTSSLAGSTGNAKRWGIEIDTDAVRAQVIQAADLLKDVAPQSEWLRKRQVKDIVADSHGDRTPIAPRPTKTSPPDIPPDSPPDRKREGEGEGEVKDNPSGGGTAPAVARVPDVPREEGPIAAAEVSKSLIAWERERGKAARNMTPSQQQVIDLAVALKSPDELRRAYEYAVADREATGDPNAVNAGFVHAMLDKVRRPPRPVREDASWKRTPAGIERKASELGVLCPPGRDHGWLLEKCESVLRQQQGVAA